MILNLCSLAFNVDLATGAGTPAWGTEMGQGDGYKFVFEDMDEFFTAMVYNAVPDINNVTCPLGKGGNHQDDYEFVIASVFKNVYVNGKKVPNAKFLALIIKKIVGNNHIGRRTLKYNPRMTYRNKLINEDCFAKMAQVLGITPNASWFVYEIRTKNQDEIHFSAVVVDGEIGKTYPSTEARKAHLMSLMPQGEGRKHIIETFDNVVDTPRQIIYYGAPGTGKSHRINNETRNRSVIRTTFHPDSDYSTFVGAYKPVMEEADARVVPVVLNNGASFDQNNGTYKEKRISYKFVKQAFLKAYLAAWKKYADGTDSVEPQFLVIEEINRGNCAQIFGDLFQLLDRNDDTNFSTYPIDADTDLQKEIKQAFSEDMDGGVENPYKLENDINIEGKVGNYTSNYGATLSKDVQEGRILLFPPNLYIWATMNTSDQSLFPIDSAFKRRWTWRYVKITAGKEGWTIKGKNYACDWWTFVQEINKKIAAATSSDDKKLGYYFCKPTDGGVIIDEETFVGKVVFYLWNDVFKDNDNTLFRVTDAVDEPSFEDFYMQDNDGNIVANPEAVVRFLINVVDAKNVTITDAQNGQEAADEQ